MTSNINEKELEHVAGGTAYANGNFVNSGDHILYTVAQGDTLIGIGSRFGVNFMTIAQWNHLGDPNLISVGQQLVIYPNVIR